MIQNLNRLLNSNGTVNGGCVFGGWFSSSPSYGDFALLPVCTLLYHFLLAMLNQILKQ